MEILHCCRCNRDWCFRGIGRAYRCGQCKTPYWDRERKPGRKIAADKTPEPEKIQTPAGVSVDTMARLREIAAGKNLEVDLSPRGNSEKTEKLESAGKFPENSESEPEPGKRCPQRAWSSELGEWVYCTLPVHSARIPHRPSRQAS